MMKFLKVSVSVITVATAAFFALTFLFDRQLNPGGSLSEDTGHRIRSDFSTEKIPDFVFVNQYGKSITQKTFEDKLYVADFFFTSCPTICPVMAGNKYKIQEAFREQEDVLLLSHSIDPVGDSVPVLKEYAERMGALPGKWHLVTGNRDTIYRIAQEYYVTAREDELDNGSFVHDGSFILVGKDRKIKGIYDGTDVASTQQLISHIKKLSQ